jgi:hypothetical protein
MNPLMPASLCFLCSPFLNQDEILLQSVVVIILYEEARQAEIGCSIFLLRCIQTSELCLSISLFMAGLLSPELSNVISLYQRISLILIMLLPPPLSCLFSFPFHSILAHRPATSYLHGLIDTGKYVPVCMRRRVCEFWTGERWTLQSGFHISYY